LKRKEKTAGTSGSGKVSLAVRVLTLFGDTQKGWRRLKDSGQGKEKKKGQNTDPPGEKDILLL